MKTQINKTPAFFTSIVESRREDIISMVLEMPEPGFLSIGESFSYYKNVARNKKELL